MAFAKLIVIIDGEQRTYTGTITHLEENFDTVRHQTLKDEFAQVLRTGEGEASVRIRFVDGPRDSLAPKGGI